MACRGVPDSQEAWGPTSLCVQEGSGQTHPYTQRVAVHTEREGGYMTIQVTRGMNSMRVNLYLSC